MVGMTSTMKKPRLLVAGANRFCSFSMVPCPARSQLGETSLPSLDQPTFLPLELQSCQYLAPLSVFLEPAGEHPVEQALLILGLSLMARKI